MRKSIIGLLLIILLFSGCILIPKQPPEKKVEVTIYNKCPWAMELEVNYPNYMIPDGVLRIGENGVRTHFYAGIPINLDLKGSYDYYSKHIYLKYGISEDETWTLEWSTYDNCYFLTRNKIKIRLN